ncbi:hypothetical protein ABW19_dt0203148 [Dactylella cylindrospora]|nr:hypothetical protein ABW19_dt0203148 [Dactylella cylindrospora]
MADPQKATQVKYIIQVGNPIRSSSHRYTFNEHLPAYLFDKTPSELTYNIISSTLQLITARISESILKKISLPCSFCTDLANHAGHRLLPVLIPQQDPKTREKEEPYIIDIMVPVCGNDECDQKGSIKSGQYLAMVLEEKEHKTGIKMKITDGRKPCNLLECGLLAKTQPDPDNPRMSFCRGPWCKEKYRALYEGDIKQG